MLKQAKNDDITYAVLSSAKNEEAIIGAESIKYQQFDDRFADTLRLQTNLLSEVKNLMEHVEVNSHYYKEFLVIQEKSKLVAEKWSKISAYYVETRRDVETMEGNLRVIDTRLLQLQTQVANFLEQRQHEEKAILERISQNMGASPKPNFNPLGTVYGETVNFAANLPPPRSPYGKIEPMVRFQAAMSPNSPQYFLAEYPSQFSQQATQYNIPVTDFNITVPLRPPAPKPPTQFLGFLNSGQPNFAAQQASVIDSRWNQVPLPVHASQFAIPQPELQIQANNLYPQPNPAQAESSHINGIQKTNTSLLD